MSARSSLPSLTTGGPPCPGSSSRTRGAAQRAARPPRLGSATGRHTHTSLTPLDERLGGPSGPSGCGLLVRGPQQARTTRVVRRGPAANPASG